MPSTGMLEIHHQAARAGQRGHLERHEASAADRPSEHSLEVTDFYDLHDCGHVRSPEAGGTPIRENHAVTGYAGAGCTLHADLQHRGAIHLDGPTRAILEHRWIDVADPIARKAAFELEHHSVMARMPR